MFDIKRSSNKEKFELALSKISLRFPVAEISQKTGYGKSQISKILKGNIPISDEFLEKFIKGFNIVFDETQKEEEIKKESDPILEALFEKLKNYKPFNDWIDNRIDEKNREIAMFLLNEELAEAERLNEKRGRNKEKG